LEKFIMTEKMFTVYPMGGWSLGEKADDGTIILTILYVDCGIRRIADRIPTQAGQRSGDCGQPLKAA
jgi:hypothetical protein